MNTGVAVAMAAVVVLAIGGFILYQYMQQQAAARRASDPATQIGQGAGLLISGIIGAAT
jgi:hypothetical protein